MICQKKDKILVSACLAGEKCRYDGGSTPDKNIIKMVENGKAIAVCPEVLGGLKTPRTPAEIIGGDGYDVLNGDAKIIDIEGIDKTEEFLKGAKATLEKVKQEKITKAILKSKSPSCGAKQIYDGTFSGILKDGYGITAALLIKSGVDVSEIYRLSINHVNIWLIISLIPFLFNGNNLYCN